MIRTENEVGKLVLRHKDATGHDASTLAGVKKDCELCGVLYRELMTSVPHGDLVPELKPYGPMYRIRETIVVESEARDNAKK